MGNLKKEIAGYEAFPRLSLSFLWIKIVRNLQIGLTCREL